MKSSILLIEDEPQMRSNMRTVLELEGYHVQAVSNGRLGIEALRADKPDLVLCDVMMPELDGYGVLALMRSKSETVDIPFIFLTAKGEKADVRTGMNSGADDYLVKPVGIRDLIDAIESRLRRKREQVVNAVPALPSFDSPTPLESLGLTPKEAEVLLWIAQGKSNSETAILLGSAEATVKKHMERILQKLDVENRGAAALIAIETLTRA
ncbi:response regulator transcription factor [Roseimicrobium sp. ORNL1]|uniref:response regulator transcription factor n=1 Tax=Roseimicrobium sp. ORNL1 TaxID=2711231 RepID=UPI0013E14947|nr:response regulator transcription factor [Roseimicrobium sp. ORNL1]QIF04613.1 response regulator transcription factor [Roseimicrobium sp. ORNL1]